VLFSEPKIPQCWNIRTILNFIAKFQCSSASRKFLNRGLRCVCVHRPAFQCSSASRKFLNSACVSRGSIYSEVSVLFNEPKLLKFSKTSFSREIPTCFSALQRAEIAEIARALMPRERLALWFQCSSTSRNC